MEISLNHQKLGAWGGSILIFGLLEEDIKDQLNPFEEVCKTESIEKFLNENKFHGKKGEKLEFQIIEKNFLKIIFVGLGKAEDLIVNDLREATASGAKSSIGIEGSLGIIFPWELFNAIDMAKAIYESARLSLFKDLRFRSDADPYLIPNKLDLIGIPIEEGIFLKEISSICSGVELARQLVGAPPNVLTPSQLAEEATKISKLFKLEHKILSKKECEAKGMGAFLAVAKGSDLEPKFIHLTYKPKGKVKRKIVMIGKGLTFDSGGYNLKVGAAQIEMMKYDMGGSAAVIGAARAIGEINPPEIEVHFIIASCENMINGSAVHPGDIVKASNGKTIEINNTDAEGRLTLADALVYACDIKPDAIVDLATLTGACVIALGDEIAGLWSNNDSIAKELKQASESCGEGLWQMPLKESYKSGLKSMLADLKNTGPRAGGSITAALFLKDFIKDEIPWAHLDIAGTCWTDKDQGINPAGATGFGVRTLVNWACSK